MSIPIMAQRGSYKVELEKGKNYLFCTCGASKKQPFCDGLGHKSTPFQPKLFKAEKDGLHFICGCKRAKTLPYCDGTHKNL